MQDLWLATGERFTIFSSFTVLRKNFAILNKNKIILESFIFFPSFGQKMTTFFLLYIMLKSNHFIV
ncbi:MAG: hypothetical protein CSA20_03720 [Deltaproteobacteria bacterium]|nr:MAG: hypothetical protein CSA20_03720 [Deltaproteobacteria bacterium]